MDNYKDLKISDHFLDRCAERAPWFVIAIKKKLGGGFKLNLPKICYAIKEAKKINRPNTISRLIRYGDKTKYYHFDKVKLNRQVIFVVENNLLVTVYLYNNSWAVNK